MGAFLSHFRLRGTEKRQDHSEANTAPSTDKNMRNIISESKSAPTLEGSRENSSNCRRPTSHEFVWKYGGQKVILTGTFDQWQQTILMTRDFGQNNGTFRASIDLDPSQTWLFKFVVDGVWRCSLDFPTHTDVDGNVNNTIFPEPLQPSRSQLGKAGEEDKFMAPTNQSVKNLASKWNAAK